MKMTVRLAAEATGHTAGKLGNTSKMPGFSTSTPASACPMGSKLAQRPGSVCAGCYALKGHYMWPDAQKGLKRRLEALRHALWVDGMVFLIKRRVKPDAPYFRWHDSGDLQGVWHLENIAAVCRGTPEVRHWLPTREVATVKAFCALNKVPPNLTIRVSSFMVGAAPMVRMPRGVLTSTVDWQDAPQTCPAPEQGGECRDCRRCWESPLNVNYRKH